MHIPEWFSEALGREFPHLRIRWSRKRCAFQIEQQVGRGALPPIRIDPDDDKLIRARDGFWFVCEVAPGDRVPCPTCRTPLKVPHCEFKEVTCEKCFAEGLDGKVVVGYFPLNEALLQHLRRTDPLRGALERVADELDAANDRLLASQARDLRTYVDGVARDEFSTIFDIPSVGYTGKERYL